MSLGTLTHIDIYIYKNILSFVLNRSESESFTVSVLHLLCRAWSGAWRWGGNLSRTLSISESNSRKLSVKVPIWRDWSSPVQENNKIRVTWDTKRKSVNRIKISNQWETESVSYLQVSSSFTVISFFLWTDDWYVKEVVRTTGGVLIVSHLHLFTHCKWRDEGRVKVRRLGGGWVRTIVKFLRCE